VTQAAGVQVIFASLTGDTLLDMLFAALLTILAYSSLAVVLLVATLAASSVIGIHVALGLVLGANLGSGLLAMLSTARSPPEARRVTLGNFLFKLIACIVVVPLLGILEPQLARLGDEARQVVLFHLLFNVGIAVVFLFLTEPIARVAERLMPKRPDSEDPAKPRYLDPSALATPALAISCAAREALRIGDVIEQMLTGMLAVLSTAHRPLAARRLPIGNLTVKLIGCVLMLPLLGLVQVELQQWLETVHQQVVVFHLVFNILLAVTFIGLTGPLARTLERWFKAPRGRGTDRPQHLDPSALATPSLAISCAAREALHQADVVETMLRGILPVMRGNDLELAERLRKMDDQVDSLYTAIKLYLTQVSREALSEREGRRWTDVMSFTINMEQIGDIIERVLQDLEDKKIRPNRSFSEAGMGEICHLHERLLANLRLGMSVFLDGHVRDARKLLEEKARFRDLEREYAASHIARLQDNTTQSIETSSLHLDLISDLKRINSHICSIAYPILDSAGALTQTRIRHSVLTPNDVDEPAR
jgi:phosphate:Na+ symporter